MLVSLFALPEASIRCGFYLPLYTHSFCNLIYSHGGQNYNLVQDFDNLSLRGVKNVLMVSVLMLVSIPESEHALVTRWGVAYLIS